MIYAVNYGVKIFTLISTKCINITLDQEVLAQLDLLVADKRYVNRSQIIEEAIIDYAGLGRIIILFDLLGFTPCNPTYGKLYFIGGLPKAALRERVKMRLRQP